MKYILTKYSKDDPALMCPISSVELTEEELKFLHEESLNYDSDFTLSKKIRKVLE